MPDRQGTDIPHYSYLFAQTGLRDLQAVTPWVNKHILVFLNVQKIDLRAGNPSHSTYHGMLLDRKSKVNLYTEDP